MIRVIITRQEGIYKSFICSGHAEYASSKGIRGLLRPHGDVVCAGVSAIVINTVNCLQDRLHEDIGCDYDEEEGYSSPEDVWRSRTWHDWFDFTMDEYILGAW